MLEVKNLQKKYNKANTPALNDVSFSIQQGEFIAVLGLSGAGKSTLIRCINRLVEPSAGDIIWNDDSILSYRGEKLRQYRSSIGMIFQSFNLIERMSTMTNVLVGFLGVIPLWRGLFFQFKKEEKKFALHALERVGLGDFANQRVSKLSGGQRQRVAIARSLVQKPKIILGDEPVASLDPNTSLQVMSLLKEINEQDRITMIINLHDVKLAKEFATRIIGISNGKVVFDGKPSELTQKDLENIY
ncbi:phosphonate transport system ATP-binding protein [Bacillus mesophilus]|uniref:Phosphonate ABC transporter ATP-binding protein n=1 Tax=Bacillus mesophilus TaxID=1808955 RepID=A0A6M0Q1S0_9BACI|nr:phosphonate ABC transporter ATP-binding protein [Bacillus mesophilus]MBM7659239.1 phosphonate transport system ATP-binding protein [Bacillus mesophilus]NEY70114.1 phosphonate ABC transporter ATP-binding protein [Bacillus mesophilus]